MSRLCSRLPVLALALLASVPGSARPAEPPTGALDVRLLSDPAAAGGKLILLSPQELLVYYPQRKKAEQVDISRYSKRIRASSASARRPPSCASTTI
jgi:hypothetical protein